MSEPVALVIREATAPGLDQLSADEAGQMCVERLTQLWRNERGERASLEDPADHGRTLEQAQLGRAEAIEARREQRLQGCRDRQLARAVSVFGQEGDQLLDVERIAFRCLGDSSEGVPGQRPAARQLDHGCRLFLGKRIEPNQRRVLARGPRRPFLE